MLGRLEISVDECIAAYSELAADVFGEKLHHLPVNIKERVQSRFDSATLETAIRKVITRGGASETALFNDGIERGCRTFVCSIDRDTKDMVRLRSYSLPNKPSIRATICEAALATSAATTFFNPISIGDRTFADGGFGANNPADEIATETEATEKKFIARWAKHFDEKRYFCFNVEQGLQNIGLEEYKKKGAIEAASEGYLTHMAQKFRVRDCIQNLRLKQSTAAANLSYIIQEYNVQRMIIELCITSRAEAPWIVPFQKNTQFVGRTLEIAEISTLLANKSRCERVAIVGIGGVGKTQIALEFAHQWRETHPDCAVFWIPVTNVESMLEAYLEIGQQLQIPNIEQEKGDVQKLVQRRLGQESSGRWLLVFDNADDIDMWTEKAGGTAGSGRRIDYLPKSKHGSILFTTRSRKVATKLAGKNVVSVSEMDDAAAKGLLEKSLMDQDLLDDDQATAALLVKLTYLPLAIVQAAAYMNENQINLSDMGLHVPRANCIQKGHGLAPHLQAPSVLTTTYEKHSNSPHFLHPWAITLALAVLISLLAFLLCSPHSLH
ncbi:hypothetical protein CC80DRAFT_536030 [Byssothecium circinans]|uniref:Uncharacterized protein n=1 Tax=Byssothecium circinans TaxID=147558 RepID=A0A6A5TT17_9PLEO|nr:hypothetical protein CC80DRAFT_536030 [Byssothecium circinans]